MAAEGPITTAVRSFREFVTSVVTPPTATEPASASNVALSSRTKPYISIWLNLSDDPRFPLADLHETYAVLCRDAPVTRETTQAFDAIERDVSRTFGGLGKFDTQAGRDKLRRVLGAYALYDPEVGYVQGMNFLVGFMLLFTDGTGDDALEADCFALLCRIMKSPTYHLRGLFLHNLPDIGVTSFIVKHLLWKHLPDLAGHFEAHGCDPVFFFEWYFTLYTYILPPAMCAEVWQMFFADGWSAVFKVMIALLTHAQPHILGKDFHGTVMVLKGYQNYRLSEEYPRLFGKGGSASTPAEGALPSVDYQLEGQLQQTYSPTLRTFLPLTWEAMAPQAQELANRMGASLDAAARSGQALLTRVATRLNEAMAPPPTPSYSSSSPSAGDAGLSTAAAGGGEGAASSSASPPPAPDAAAPAGSGSDSDLGVGTTAAGSTTAHDDTDPHAIVRDVSRRGTESPPHPADPDRADRHAVPGHERVSAALSRGSSTGAAGQAVGPTGDPDSHVAPVEGVSTAGGAGRGPPRRLSDELQLDTWVRVEHPPHPRHEVFTLAPPQNLVEISRLIRITPSEVDELRRRGKALQEDEAVRRENERILRLALAANDDPAEAPDALVAAASDGEAGHSTAGAGGSHE